MSRPTIAAIVPTRNGARWISDTMAAIAASDPAPDEVVLIDDASTDGSAMLALTALPSAVVVRHDVAAGVSGARNAGVAATRSEWLAFCDHDDRWTPGHLTALLAAAQQTGHRWVTGRIRLAVADGFEPPERALRTDGTHLPYLLGASLIHRSVWTELGGLDPTLPLGEDVDLYLRYCERGVPAVLVDDVTLIHRLHPASVMASRSATAAQTTFDVIRTAARRRRQTSTARDGQPLSSAS